MYLVRNKKKNYLRLLSHDIKTVSSRLRMLGLVKIPLRNEKENVSILAQSDQNLPNVLLGTQPLIKV